MKSYPDSRLLSPRRRAKRPSDQCLTSELVEQFQTDKFDKNAPAPTGPNTCPSDTTSLDKWDVAEVSAGYQLCEPTDELLTSFDNDQTGTGGDENEDTKAALTRDERVAAIQDRITAMGAQGDDKVRACLPRSCMIKTQTPSKRTSVLLRSISTPSRKTFWSQEVPCGPAHQTSASLSPWRA